LDISYQPSLTHRVSIQQGNTALPVANATYDFVPAGGAVSTTREIVSTAKCNACHNKISAHGSRIEAKLCVACHNPGSWDNSVTGNTQPSTSSLSTRFIMAMSCPAWTRRQSADDQGI
jgi:OmcA/MtrC family decaheme c-type cytochrome